MFVVAKHQKKIELYFLWSLCFACKSSLLVGFNRSAAEQHNHCIGSMKKSIWKKGKKATLWKHIVNNPSTETKAISFGQERSDDGGTIRFYRWRGQIIIIIWVQSHVLVHVVDDEYANKMAICCGVDVVGVQKDGTKERENLKEGSAELNRAVDSLIGCKRFVC